MIISKRKVSERYVVKKNIPSIRLNKSGHIILNKAMVELLEIENPEKDGIAFGYDFETGKSYIGYSSDHDSYKGRFKPKESSFRFGSVYERDNIITCSLGAIDELSFPIILTVSPDVFEIVEKNKMYLLNYQPTK